jgi:hypothetical protein
MRFRQLCLLVLCVLLLAGCPKEYTFTSADDGGNNRNLYGPPAGPDTTDDEGAEGEEEREVVEPDVIRRTGSLLYVLNQYRGLTIVDLDTETVLGQAPTFGYPRDLYLVGDRAYVLVSGARNVIALDGITGFDLETRLYVLDVSDPANPENLGTFEMEGDLLDSRLVGDVLYAVAAEYQWYYEDTEVVRKQAGASWVTSINVADPANIHEADEVSFAGLGNIIQATNFAIFVAAHDWNTQRSQITYVDISDAAGAIDIRGSIGVPGIIPDRFKMDAWNGVLRVVSNTGWPDRETLVTTVDLADPDALRMLGQTKVEGATGETLFATRFDGPRGYIVTFLVVDPLFVLDLSDPTKPTVAGVLEVPGWSTHIEPQGDRLVALGVDDSNGRRVSVSLFDVADPYHPALADRVSFGEGWSWSNAYNDVKAFTVLDDTLIVPFSGWHEEAGGFERLQFVSYEGLDLTLRGFVDLDGQILRSFEFEEGYYGVTTEQVAVIDGANLDTPVVTNRIVLAEYVEDFLELSGGRTAELVTHFDSGETTVRGAAGGVAGGELQLPVIQPVAVHPFGSGIVLVSTGWDERPYYRVDVIAMNAAGTPELSDTIFAEVEPYWGGWWWGGPEPVAFDARTAKDMAMPYWRPWRSPEETTFLLGDRLVLRCMGNTFDVTFGDKDLYQGLAIVNLQSGKLERTIGLAFERIEAIVPSGDRLVLNTAEGAGRDGAFRPLVAFFVRELNIAAPSLGEAANVPGRVLEHDPVSRILTLRDTQYMANGSFSQQLRTVSWLGGTVLRLLGALELPDGTSSILARGNRIYLDYYDQGYHAMAVTMDSQGELVRAGAAKLTDQWANLVDAQGDDLVVSIAGAFIGHYRIGDGELAQVQLVEVMSTPNHVRFGADTIYAPLGYAGLERLALVP